MKISLEREDVNTTKKDVAVLLTEEHTHHLSTLKTKQPYQELITSLVTQGEFKGEPDQLVLVHTQDRIHPKHLFLTGLGKEKNLTPETIRRALSLVVNRAKQANTQEFTVLLDIPHLKPEEIVRAATEGILLADYKFLKYKTTDLTKNIQAVTLIPPTTEHFEKQTRALEETIPLIEAVNYTKSLQYDNADVVTPIYLAEQARQLAKDHKLKLTILDEKELKKLGMNLILAVGKGSHYPPNLIILEYTGDKKSKDTTALLGKGITFDTGGLNLKPTNFIEDMRFDMSGAAVILGVMKALATLKIKKNVIGVVVAAENAIGSQAYKPGDTYVSYSKKSVKIANTDAEGRLVLADAIAYTADVYKPARMIDVATLTGAVRVALGEFVAGMMGTDDDTMSKLYQAGQTTHERVWKLPLYEDYEKDLPKPDTADITHDLHPKGYAGSIAGGIFLKNFVNNTPWVHLDIAGTSNWEKPRYYHQKGGTGFGVRLLVEYLKHA